MLRGTIGPSGRRLSGSDWRKVEIMEDCKRDRALVLGERVISDLEQGGMTARRPAICGRPMTLIRILYLLPRSTRVFLVLLKETAGATCFGAKLERNPHPSSAEAYLDTLCS